MAGLDVDQVKRAVTALYAHLKDRSQRHAEAQEKKSLFEDDSDVFLSIQLKRTPDQTKTKPYLIPLPHSIFGQEGMQVCLLTKDPQKDYEQKLRDEPVDNVVEVISITKLKKEFKQYEDKRKLLSSFDLFLADDRIIRMLPALLGKKFFEKKRQPMPVDISGKGWASAVAAARDGTALILGGSHLSIRVGRTSFPREHVVDNITSSIQRIVDRVPRKWKNIQAIFLKSHNSAALPLYQSMPDREATSQNKAAAAGTETSTEAADVAAKNTAELKAEPVSQGSEAANHAPPAARAKPTIASKRARGNGDITGNGTTKSLPSAKTSSSAKRSKQ